MRVALLTNYPAFPTTSGNRSRILGLARAVRELGHELHFVFLPSMRGDDVDDEAHRQEFGAGNFTRLSCGSPLLRELYYKQRALRMRLHPLAKHSGINQAHYATLDFPFNPYWQRELARIGRQVDAVIVEYVFNSKALDSFPAGVRRIIDTHDSFGDRHRRYARAGLGDGYWISLRPSAENRGFRRADSLLAIQSEEAETFRRQLDDGCGPTPEVAVVSHFLDLTDRLARYGTDSRALFLASDTPSNRQAVSWFMDQVLPRVVAADPQFEFRLVGSICKAVTPRPNVTLLGRIDRLADAFVQAPVSLNPMLSGTGINIKLLDAMAHGVPTVSTETGLRGLPARYHQGVIGVADDDPVGFAEAVLRLTGDAGLRETLGAAAHADAERWNAEQAAELQRCLGGATA